MDEDEPPFLQPELRPAPPAPPAPQPAAKPAARRAAPKQAGPLQPFPQWTNVLQELEETDAMLISFLRGTKAYYDGTRVLFECSDAFRDYARSNKEVNKKLKEAIYKVSRIKCGIGPYEPPKAEPAHGAPNLEDTLRTMQTMGVTIQIEDK